MIKYCEKCTGCSACAQVCPVNAITMSKDEEGYLYPTIDNEKCISCNKCEKICPINSTLSVENKSKVFAFINNNNNVLLKSSSGGFFPSIAEYVIENNGCVYGCIFDEKLKAIHTRGFTTQDIEAMQGSKYVQSTIGECFKDAENDLDKGKIVLFSGTPCQIDGLIHYLGKPYEKLITLDIVCHGVPSQEMLDRELLWLKDIRRSEVRELAFRDKSVNGWSLIGTVLFDNGSKKRFTPSNDPYYCFFDRGEIYRKSCYLCRYASLHRVGDFTIGDFWGIERNKEIRKFKDVSKGVSLVLVNTEKAEKIIKKIEKRGFLKEVDTALALKENLQLIHPVDGGKRKSQLIKLYHDNDRDAISKLFQEEVKRNFVKRYIIEHIPAQIKYWLKGII